MNRPKREPVDLSALSCLAPELAEMLAAVACDIALVLDDGGVIRNVVHGGTQSVAETAGAWIGQRWTETVTDDTRHKAQELLDDLASTGISRLRHFNHASDAGSDIPVAYTAVRLGERGPTLAVGRDLRTVTAMQQRLLATQQAIEADHWQRRQIETRQRLVFQVSTESILLIDAATFDVIDANRSAALLLGRAADQLIGQAAASAFCASAHAPIDRLLTEARDSGRAAEVLAEIAGGLGQVEVSVTSCAAETSGILLMSLRARSSASPLTGKHAADDHADLVFATLVRRTQDAIVVCESDGRVTLANEAFRKLVHWPSGSSMTGRELSRWIGTDDADGDGTVRRVLSTARSDGSVGLLMTRLRRPHDRWIDIELSATLIVGTDSVGFIVRVSHQQDSSGSASAQDAHRNLH